MRLKDKKNGEVVSLALNPWAGLSLGGEVREEMSGPTHIVCPGGR